jgi:hypothetical protein
VGVARIRHLVDLDIKLSRCNQLIAANPEIVVATTDENGNPRKSLNPVYRFNLLLMGEHARALRSLREYNPVKRYTPREVEMMKQLEERRDMLLKLSQVWQHRSTGAVASD